MSVCGHRVVSTYSVQISTCNYIQKSPFNPFSDSKKHIDTCTMHVGQSSLCVKGSQAEVPKL